MDRVLVRATEHPGIAEESTCETSFCHEHDRSVALVVLAPFFDGYFSALFADNARWFSPLRYEVGEGRRSQFGPVVLGNSVEGGFFAVDDDRVGGVYVGDED